MMQDTAAPAEPPRQLQVDYHADADAGLWLAREDVLAVFGFGATAGAHEDPRWLRVPLEPHGPPQIEVWRTRAPVRHGRDAGLQWAEGGGLLFGAIEITEGDAGILGAAREAYARMEAELAARGHPHVLRIWNYFDDITLGEGDAERYRGFCVGRVQGMAPFEDQQLPAATAIGRRDGRRVLQVYWLAAREPGRPVDNPRQVSPYRYPRQYGPQSPSFARAMLPPPGFDAPLMLSGTAAIVGHASRHPGDPLRQLDETLRNLDALIATARETRPALPARLDHEARLKVYVRDAGDLPRLAEALRERLPDTPHLLLHAAVCRRELVVEIDGVHG